MTRILNLSDNIGNYSFTNTESGVSGAGTGNEISIIEEIKKKLDEGYAFGEVKVRDENLKKTLQTRLGVIIN
jgi:hypothetical protein